MAETQADYETGPIKSAAESYIKRLEMEENKRKLMIDHIAEYNRFYEETRTLEKILGKRIKDNCVSVSNGQVLVASSGLGLNEYRIFIKQAIK